MRLRPPPQTRYQSWLIGELVLATLLSVSLAVFLDNPALPRTYNLPLVRLVLDTVVVLVATIVAVLTGARYSVDERRLDLLLCTGFAVTAASTFFFSVAPVLGGQPLHRAEAWAGVAGGLLAAGLVACAPYGSGKPQSRTRAFGLLGALGVALLLFWPAAHSIAGVLPSLTNGPRGDQPILLTGALALHALLSLIAAVGFGLRFRARGEDLDRWLALGATVLLFASLFYVFTPLLSSSYVSQGDFLRLVSFCVLLVGVWRAVRSAEFGRAVADERARVAREIHDGLAQYLFAIATHARMLETGAPLETTLPRLKDAAAAAQQEAKFAVLALSSASGNAPFDAALRRYVEFLTADGGLEVDVEIDEGVRLGPDEQIELFRIVQEGLANVRKHSRSRRAEVTIGRRAGRRLVIVRDYGTGFEPAPDETGAGQGLKNIRARAASIGGALRLESRPGRGTELEILLRA